MKCITLFVVLQAMFLLSTQINARLVPDGHKHNTRKDSWVDEFIDSHNPCNPLVPIVILGAGAVNKSRHLIALICKGGCKLASKSKRDDCLKTCVKIRGSEWDEDS